MLSHLVHKLAASDWDEPEQAPITSQFSPSMCSLPDRRNGCTKFCLPGFHTEGNGGGGPWNFPPSRNLEIEYGYYCFVTGIKQQSCPRLCQKQSKCKLFLEGGGTWVWNMGSAWEHPCEIFHQVFQLVKSHSWVWLMRLVDSLVVASGFTFCGEQRTLAS